MQRWIDVGFTPGQAELLSTLVTRDYLDERLTELRIDMRSELRSELQTELRLHKRGMLAWMIAMQAPVYAALIYIVMKLGL
jgi:hypothetical protein